jgi:hypothetical protein
VALCCVSAWYAFSFYCRANDAIGDRTNYSNTAPLCFASTVLTCPLSLSLSSLLLDVSSYNLSGMGCSAGIISIELVKNMLAAKPNSTALIVSI